MNLDILTGKTTEHLKPFMDSPHFIHREMEADLKAMFEAALRDDIALAITSSFRSYEAQKNIWNNKVSGLRPVLDSNSIPIDIASISKTELMFSIMRWSAIPGGSRHHWGTDFDVYDQKAKPLDYELQLVPSEYLEGGMFHNAHLWLNDNMNRFGFFRPYAIDRGGIAPEPWHLSYRPLSEKFMEELSFEEFEKHLTTADFLLREEALANAAEIYTRFILI